MYALHVISCGNPHEKSDMCDMDELDSCEFTNANVGLGRWRTLQGQLSTQPGAVRLIN
jgi:hypothetical protein